MGTASDLNKFSCFIDFEAEELNEIFSLMQSKVFKKGSLIVQEDDPGLSMMFLVDGVAKVNLISEDGKEIILAMLSSGEFFGELAILTDEDRSANVEAVKDCETMILSEDNFYKILNSNQKFSIGLLKSLATRLRSASGKIADLALYDVYRRIARTLQGLAVETEIADEIVYIIEKRPTHQELAAMSGTGREMVTRALKGLEEDGCIKIDGKTITICKDSY